MASVIKGCEPFGYEGDDTGVLLIHGYTGSPQGLRLWGDFLGREGFTVLCPRLPGHGTDVADLAKARWEDWVAEVEMSLRGLRERCQSIFVGALSMGGALALDLAERHGDVINGLALVNPFLFTDDPRAKLAPLLAKLPLTVKGVGDDVADRTNPEIFTPRLPTKTSGSMLMNAKKVLDGLARVTQPLVVFTSRQDHIVKTANSTLIMERVSSTDKEHVWLDRSYHVATLDFDKETIFERSAAFFRSHAKA
jgi:carboxylesterase